MPPAEAAKTYRLTRRAEADLESIWLYSAKHWSVPQANRYYRAIIQCFEALARGAKKGTPTDVREGYLRYPVGVHVIFFRRQGGSILVVRVLHERMDVDRHLE